MMCSLCNKFQKAPYEINLYEQKNIQAAYYLPQLLLTFRY